MNILIRLIITIGLCLPTMYGMQEQKAYITLLLPKGERANIPAKDIGFSGNIFCRNTLKIKQSPNSAVILKKNFIESLLNQDLGSRALKEKTPENIIYTADYINLKKQEAFLATIAAHRAQAKSCSRSYLQPLLQKLCIIQPSIHNNFNNGHLILADPKCNTLYNFAECLQSFNVPPSAINHLTIALPALDGIHPEHMQDIISNLKNLRTIIIENTAIASIYKDTFKNIHNNINLIIRNNCQLHRIEAKWCKKTYHTLECIHNPTLVLTPALFPHLKQPLRRGIVPTYLQKIWNNITQKCSSENCETMRNVSLDIALIAVSILPKNSEFYKYAALNALESRYIKYDSIKPWGIGILSCMNAGIYAWYISHIMQQDVSEEEKMTCLYYATGMFSLSLFNKTMNVLQKLYFSVAPNQLSVSVAPFHQQTTEEDDGDETENYNQEHSSNSNDENDEEDEESNNSESSIGSE